MINAAYTYTWNVQMAVPVAHSTAAILIGFFILMLGAVFIWLFVEFMIRWWDR